MGGGWTKVHALRVCPAGAWRKWAWFQVAGTLHHSHDIGLWVEAMGRLANLYTPERPPAESVREPRNRYDANAIAIMGRVLFVPGSTVQERMVLLGYVPGHLAADAPDGPLAVQVFNVATTRGEDSHQPIYMIDVELLEPG